MAHTEARPSGKPIVNALESRLPKEAGAEARPTGMPLVLPSGTGLSTRGVVADVYKKDIDHPPFRLDDRRLARRLITPFEVILWMLTIRRASSESSRFGTAYHPNTVGAATMLINHDFDWEGDSETSPRCEVGAGASQVVVSISISAPPDPQKPAPEIIVVEKPRGFSPVVLTLAIATLVLLATLRLLG